MYPKQPHFDDADWKRAYLRRNAPLNTVVLLVVLAASVLLHLPDIRFILAGVAGGICAYFTWSKPELQERTFWLVPLVVIPAALVAVKYGEGANKLVLGLQFLGTIFASLSACFLLETRWCEKPAQREADET